MRSGLYFANISLRAYGRAVSNTLKSGEISRATPARVARALSSRIHRDGSVMSSA